MKKFALPEDINPSGISARSPLDEVLRYGARWENRKDLWEWIEGGAYFYVCGDAKEMAKDVEAMLVKIFAFEGGLPEEEARRKLKALRVEKRYLADVY